MANGGVAGTNLIYGLMLSSSSDHGDVNMNNNNVNLTTTSGSKYSIYSSGTSATGFMNINNNTLGYGAASTGSTYGIYRFGTAATANMNNNTIPTFSAFINYFFITQIIFLSSSKSDQLIEFSVSSSSIKSISISPT